MGNVNASATSKCLGRWMLASCISLLGLACGRTPLIPVCLIEVTPSSLDFGQVVPAPAATGVTMSLSVGNHGNEACQIYPVLAPSSDPSFALAPLASQPLVVNPGEHAPLAATFNPTSTSLPLARVGTLVLQSNDPIRPRLEVPLAGRIRTDCRLNLRPFAVNFGHVHIDSTASFSVAVVNNGTSTCEIAGIAIAPGSDPQFALDPAQVDHFSLAPGIEQSIVPTFHATDLALPHHRTGNLVFESSDDAQANVTIPLSADIDIGCDLTVAPDAVDFGKVILNTTARSGVTLGNDGSDPCQVSGVDFGPGSDPGFALDPDQARAFTVVPGSSRAIPVSFGAFDSAPPHLRTGTLVLQTGNSRAPTASVGLSATVDSACIEASQWIYTVDGTTSMFSRFDPATLTFTDIGVLKCPGHSTPFSMAVDQNAVAWVTYYDGNLYRVDTGTAQCEATSFQVRQHGIFQFGMGFVFTPSQNLDTLYIAGDDGTGDIKLATVSFPSLVVTPIGTVTAGEVELTGTGDGSLWGFVPSGWNPDDQSELVRLDPDSGATLESYSYFTLVGGSSWAMKFWGGSFWIFLDGALYEVPRATPQTIRTAIADTGRDIVGAGVSTCAPLLAFPQ